MSIISTKRGIKWGRSEFTEMAMFEIPLGKFDEAEDVAGAVIFPASDESS